VSRRTLVTGAGSGIGRSLARHLGRRGHWVAGIDVAWTDRSAVDLALDADLTDSVAVAAALETVGSLDAVVANAAVTDLAHHRVVELPMATWRRVFDVNVTATVALLQRVVPGMIARGGGNVLIVTSSLGTWKGGIAGDAVYSSSKAALEAFAHVLALETRGTGVNVNTIYPSVRVDTGFFRGLSAPERAALHPPTLLDEPAAFLAELPPGRLSGISLDQQAWSDDPGYRRRLRGADDPPGGDDETEPRWPR
jgi:NAD(P)-dependent dehydrogenase (short-subunit alcohol dehydrogenase family)